MLWIIKLYTLKQNATCPFASIWLKRHPEYDNEDLFD